MTLHDVIVAPVLRAKMSRAKRKAKPIIKARALPKEQLTMPQSEKRVQRERYSWKGGLTAVKNIPENFQEEK